MATRSSCAAPGSQFVRRRQCSDPSYNMYAPSHFSVLQISIPQINLDDDEVSMYGIQR